jgi:hypothetical protein
MRSKDELRRLQTQMRTKTPGKRRQRAVLAPFDVRRAAILEGMVRIGRADAPWDWLRAWSAYRPYGRGWWIKTITEMLATGELRRVKTFRGDVIQRTTER